MQVGELGLELDVIVGGAGDVAGAAGAGADRVDRLVHGREHGGMLAHAEIVVRAPDGDGMALLVGLEVLGGGKLAPAALQVGEDAVAPFAMQRLEMLSEQLFVVHFDLQRVAYDIVQTISTRRTIISKLSPKPAITDSVRIEVVTKPAVTKELSVVLGRRLHGFSPIRSI